MVGLSERGQAIDLVTLRDELNRSGDLEEVGGPAYISALADGVPRSTNVEHYAHIVKEHATLRDLIHSANKIAAAAYSTRDDAEVVLDRAEQEIFSIAEGRIHTGFVPLKDLVEGSFTTIEQLQEQKGFVTGVADRVRRHRRDDGRTPARRPRHRGGAPLDGQDRLRAQRRPARRDGDRADRRRLQPGDVEGAALHADADVGGARRFAPGPHRHAERGRLQPPVGGAGRAVAGARVRRRHAGDGRAGDAREVAAPEGGARARPGHHRLPAVDAGAGPVREPHAGDRVDLALAQAARQGARGARDGAVAAQPRPRVARRPAAAALRPAGVRRASSRTPTW